MKKNEQGHEGKGGENETYRAKKTKGLLENRARCNFSSNEG